MGREQMGREEGPRLLGVRDSCFLAHPPSLCAWEQPPLFHVTWPSLNLIMIGEKVCPIKIIINLKLSDFNLIYI